MLHGLEAFVCAAGHLILHNLSSAFTRVLAFVICTSDRRPPFVRDLFVGLLLSDSKHLVVDSVSSAPSSVDSLHHHLS